MKQGAPEVRADAVEGALEEILARPGFQPQEDPLQAVADALGRLFGDGLSDGQLVGLWVFAFVLSTLLTVLVVLWLRRRPLSRGRFSSAEAQAQRRREDVARLRAAARAARDAGELREALRLTWFALVVGLGERGDLAYHAAWTNRELLERGEPSAETRSRLEPILRGIEAKEFGHEPTSLADVEQLDALCNQILGGAVA